MRLPRTYYFSGGFIRFFMQNKVPSFEIFQQLLEESKPHSVLLGHYEGQDLAELAKPYVLEPQFKRILKQ